jgi:hypothetical protein
MACRRPFDTHVILTQRPRQSERRNRAIALVRLCRRAPFPVRMVCRRLEGEPRRAQRPPRTWIENDHVHPIHDCVADNGRRFRPRAGRGQT